MKIGINALYLLPGKVGGSETYIRNLVRTLADSDRENEYVLFINRESAGVFDADAPGFRIVPCPVRAESRPLRILWEQLILPFQVRRYGIDVLFSAGMTAPLWVPASSVLLVYDLQHVNQPGNYNRLYLLFLRSIIYASARRSDGIVTISRQAKSDIVRHYHIPENDVAVTHLAVDHGVFRSGDGSAAGTVRAAYGLPERYILYAASSLPHKNHERLFEAFASVRNDIPGLKLVLIGARDKGEERLSALIRDLGLVDDVVLLGWVPFGDVPGIYRAGEAFVFPTLHEGFGLPVIEAMACGVPVVCSGIEPLREIAGDAALFINPLDAASIANGIRQVVLDAGKRRSLVEKGLRRSTGFTWQATASGTLEFLRSVRGRRRS